MRQEEKGARPREQGQCFVLGKSTPGRVRTHQSRQTQTNSETRALKEEVQLSQESGVPSDLGYQANPLEG